MRSLSQPLIDDSHFFMSGHVVVHPNAAIAPSVFLQADPGSQLIVAAGVCIGAGTVLHAYQGILQIEAGVTLGSGVLIIGNGTIRAGVCIGALTTIMDSAIQIEQSVPSGSLLGKVGRQVDLSQTRPSEPPIPLPTAASPPSPVQEPAVSSPPSASPPPSPKVMTQVYGQAYLERIMITMFPHRQQFDAALPEPPRDDGDAS